MPVSLPGAPFLLLLLSIPLPATLRSSCPHCGPPVISCLVEAASSVFLTLPPSDTNYAPIPYGAQNSLATLHPHGNSGDLTLGSAYYPGEVTAVAKGTGGCKESGRRGPWGGKVWTVKHTD